MYAKGYGSHGKLNGNGDRSEEISVEQLKKQIKALEDKNTQLKEKILQQTQGIELIIKENEKYVQYCVDKFNKQVQEANDDKNRLKGVVFHLRAHLESAVKEVDKLTCEIKELSERQSNHTSVKSDKNSSNLSNESELSKSEFKPMVFTSGGPPLKKQRMWQVEPKPSPQPSKQSDESKVVQSEPSNAKQDKSAERIDNRKLHKKIWTTEMETKLINAVQKYGPSDWETLLSKSDIDVTVEQAVRRWNLLIKTKPDLLETANKKQETTPKIKKRNYMFEDSESEEIEEAQEDTRKKSSRLIWTAEMDKQLKSMALKYPKDWKKIANELDFNVTSEQVRLHYTKYVETKNEVDKKDHNDTEDRDDEISIDKRNQLKWSPEMENSLREAVMKNGTNSWALIAKYIDFTATPNQLKQHYHLHLKDQIKANNNYNNNYNSNSPIRKKNRLIVESDNESESDIDKNEPKINLKWTNEMNKQLKKASEKHGRQWKKIAAELDFKATPKQLSSHALTANYKKQKLDDNSEATWSARDDESITSSDEESEDTNEAEHVAVVNWTADKDASLLEAVHTYGTKWKTIVKKLDFTASPGQIAQRYHRHLKGSNYKTGRIGAPEDEIIRHAIEERGENDKTVWKDLSHTLRRHVDTLVNRWKQIK